MILATFYQFNKKENSTKLPSETSSDVFTTYQCLLKDSTSILNPTLILRVDTVGAMWNPAQWTYCYIPDFGRYYFVEDWRHVLVNWEVTLSVDVLGTYRGDIGGATKYVLRSASDFDADVIDTLYSPTAVSTTAVNPIAFNLTDGWSWAPSQAYFIIGIAGNSTFAINGITYYVLDQALLRQLINYMYYNVLSMQWDSTESWNAVISKAFIEPLSYVTSAYWYPFSPLDAIGPYPQQTIRFGYWDITGLSANVLTQPTKDIQFSLTNPPNPYYNQGAWELLPPFANYSLVFNPFGVLPLNGMRCRNAGGISCNMRIDYTTGTALLKVMEYQTSKIITQKSALFGVPIPMGAQKDNLLSMLTDTVSAAIPAAVNAAAGNVAGTAAILANASVKVMTDVLGSTASISGNAGSLSGNSLNAEYTVVYSKPQTANNREFGSPLCADRLLATLSGYTICADGEIDTGNMFDEERKRIAQYLTSGFYME